jgi:hypothetical protein
MSYQDHKFSLGGLKTETLGSLGTGLAGRYFRRNVGTADYATIPNITMSGDFAIEFDINAPVQDNRKVISYRNTSNLNEFNITSSLIGNDGKLRVSSTSIPLINTATSMDVFDNIFHKVRFEYSIATTSFRVLVDGVEGIAPTTTSFNFNTSDLISLWRRVNDGGYLSGIIANLKIYDDGTLIRHWPIKSNASTEDDLVSGSTMTIANGTADQWGLFKEQSSGGWLGQNTAVNGTLNNGTTGYNSTNATLAVVVGRLEVTGDQSTSRATQPVYMAAGGTYEFRGESFPGTSGTQTAALFSSGFTENVSQTNINGDFFVSLTPTVTGQGELWLRSDAGTAYFDNLTVKEILNVAPIPTALFVSSVLQCSGTLSCSEIIPCG